MSYTWRQQRHYSLMGASIFIHHQSGPQSTQSFSRRLSALTPVPRYMPPTSPVRPGFPCVSIVFARTIVYGEHHGIKPFVFQLHDGQSMTPGVSIRWVMVLLSTIVNLSILPRVLPPRGGSRPINHSLTYFSHVRLPPTALLGSLRKPRDPRASFFGKIYRVAIGTIALSSLGVPSLQVASYIAARYSLRRHVVDSNGVPKPIISFQTQKQPILTAVAQSFVLQAMHKRAVGWFMDHSLDSRVRHAIATVHKVAMIQTAQWANFALGDRCGAQGLFEANQLPAMHVRKHYENPPPHRSHAVVPYSQTCGELQSPRVIFWGSLSVGVSWL